MSFDPAAAAAALDENRRAARPSGPLPAGLAPRDLAEGVAVQFALAARLGAVPPAGFKIGATAKRMQAYLGLSGPAAGFMERTNLHDSGAKLPWSRFRGVGVECEIGLRLSHPLPPGPCDVAQARAAVGDMFPAIEIVENRYGPPPAGDLKAVGTPTLVADQVFHAAAVLGAAMPDWRERDLVALPGRISVDGEERANGTGGDLLGHPLHALAWLAGSDVAAAFGGLRAGQVVMLGSVTPPIWLDGPCEVSVAFGELPPVTVRFT
jgi:2-keto-4-pentenoate hydratase